MVDLCERALEAEIMDDPSRFIDVHETYEQIAFLNSLTWAYWPIARAIKQFWDADAKKEWWDIIDLGSGYGDTLRYVHDMALQENVQVRLVGIDNSPFVNQLASEATPRRMGILFHTEDVVEPRRPYKGDVIIASLLMHHMDDDAVVRLLRRMTDHAEYGWIISELHRHPIPYYFARILTGLGRFNTTVRNDAKLSVARSFVRSEWEALIERAGIDLSHVTIRWYPNFRYVIRYAR